MSILFVLLTFLLILTVMYFRRPQEDANALQVAPAKKIAAPLMLKAPRICTAAAGGNHLAAAC